MSGITILLENGRQFIATESTSSGRPIGYRIMGRNTVDRLTNKDLTDPSNKLGVQSYRFSVSADEEVRAPYTSIQSAINAAAQTGNPETVFVFSGSYTENITLRPNVYVVGISREASIIRGTVTADNGELYISNLTIDWTGAPLEVSGEVTLHVDRCFIAGDLPSTVASADASVFFTDSTIVGSDIILVASAANRITCDRCEIGNGIPLDFAVLSGNLKIRHSFIRCLLQLACEESTIIHCVMQNDNSRVINMDGGTLNLSHNSLINDGGETYLITGTGRIYESHNSLEGYCPFAEPTLEVFYRTYDKLSGTYTPTITSSIPSQSATGTAIFSRVGNVVTVKFQMLINCGPFGQNIDLRMTLPVMQRIFSSDTEAIGIVKISQPEPAGDFFSSIFATVEDTTIRFAGVCDAASFMCGATGEFSYVYT
jgi:hypothetical protein